MMPATGPVGELAAVRPRRSGGVTIIGVLFLTIGLMWLIASLFQGAFFTFLASVRPGGIALGDVSNDPSVPVVVRFVVHYAKFFWIVNIAAAAVLTVCSAGLLRRKSWARRAFVVVSALGIAYAVISLGASALMVPFFQTQMSGLESMGVGTAMATAATVALAIVVVKSLFVGAFFGWMMWKLTRAEIREEFS